VRLRWAHCVQGCLLLHLTFRTRQASQALETLVLIRAADRGNVETQGRLCTNAGSRDHSGPLDVIRVAPSRTSLAMYRLRCTSLSKRGLVPIAFGALAKRSAALDIRCEVWACGVCEVNEGKAQSSCALEGDLSGSSCSDSAEEQTQLSGGELAAGQALILESGAQGVRSFPSTARARRSAIPCPCSYFVCVPDRRSLLFASLQCLCCPFS
jgi:hypothetical protein